MKFILYFLVTLLTCCVSVKEFKPKPSLTYPMQIPHDLTIHKLNDQIYFVQDTSFYKTNVMVVKLQSGDVFIASSQIDTVKNLAMLKWIKKALMPKKIKALNTHFHADGTGGNEAFHLSGVEIWSSHLTHKLYTNRAKNMQIGLAQMIKDKKHRKHVLQRKNMFATHFFDHTEKPKWNFEGLEIEIIYPGPAHSDDNLVVYLPEHKILFGGCMVRALDFNIGNTQDANLSDYESSIKQLFKLQIEKIIPGHGDVGGVDLLEHTLKLIRNN